ncbi:MBL fold metallo-hydrolase [Lutibacter profundi]|uniref:MBL fold metallo-hydrolase n=1 Tax=Lutibacter profundi TaxID=1622118 RepID=A0A0X8G8L7_9FLAO|nr:MBL fold metallo-hydrolase [Lutibacter profundi]AMC12091.1 MBL fold metallo-hydrolase [Lutibacter profundi]
MKLKTVSLITFLLLNHFIWSQKITIDSIITNNGYILIQPISHASFILTVNNKTILIDPSGKEKIYTNLKSPAIILITDVHGDHLNLKTLNSIDTSNTIFIVPEAVANKLPEKYNSQLTILKNNQGVHRLNMFIKAIPMYNLPENTNSKHPKGRGNGYLLTIDNKRIYISGDTEDILEMRMLQNIDIAFICMNLPYTMNINQAANAVLEFQPKIVYPFHYRGKNEYSDVAKFKKLVNAKNKNIEIRIRNWYPN